MADLRTRASQASRFPGAFLRAASALFLLGLMGIVPGLHAQDPVGGTSQEGFEKTSVALRTALHYDPAVEVPLLKLVALYRDAGRSQELLSLYEAHVSQYPQDGNAKLVLARVYAELKDRRALNFLKDAVAAHPDHALLAWEYGRLLQRLHLPGAVEQMASAVSLEKAAARRALWYGELLKAAAVQGREDLALMQTRKLLAESTMTPEQRVRWARQAHGERLSKVAAHLLEGLNEGTLGTDGSVDAQVLQAELQAAGGDIAGATRRLDVLLEKLSADHWRYRELVMLRLDIGGKAEREKWIEAARARWNKPSGRSEQDALMLADVLASAHRNNEALKVLQDATALFPESVSLEERLLDAWEKLGVEAEAIQWLEARISQQAARGDLRLRRVRWLFSTNKTNEAQQAFSELLGQLDDSQRVERTMELVRWLRRRNQPSEAASLLTAVLAKVPHRWEMRRELAEIHLSQKRREDARKLFTGTWSSSLTPDARMEVAQFLMAKQLWLEAKELVEPWVKSDEGIFEGRLLLARLHGMLSDETAMTALLNATRQLCDTPARYQAWLETAVSMAEARDMAGPWLQRETENLNRETTDGTLEKFFPKWQALLEQAVSRQQSRFAESVITGLLARSGLPADKRLLLDNLRLDIIRSDGSRVMEAETGLRRQMDADHAHRNDHLLRLALLYQQSGRGDLAGPLLETLDVGKATEVTELRAALSLFLERSMMGQALACAERLTQLEPAERNHWSQWISLLAASGGEEQLRSALREVLGKARDWSLAEDVQSQLRGHLVSSQWRSVQSLLHSEGNWGAARRLAAGFDQLELTEQERLWARWLRAWLSARLGDVDAVKDAVAALDKSATNAWLAFPDGMELSVTAAKAALMDAASRAGNNHPVPTPSDAAGPVPPFSVAWGYASDPGTILTRTELSIPDGLVLLCDNRFQFHAVDARTGKLKWMHRSVPESSEGDMPAASGRGRTLTVPPRGFRRGSRNSPEVHLAPDVASKAGRFFVLTENIIECLDAVTGEVRWRSAPDGSSVTATENSPRSRMALGPAAIYLWRPPLGRLSAIHPDSGKILWEIEVPLAGSQASGQVSSDTDPGNRLNSGIQVNDGKILLWGGVVALLDARDGSVLWRTGSAVPEGFPIMLQTEDEAAAAAASPSSIMATSQLHPGGVGSRMPGSLAITQRWAFTSVMRSFLLPSQGPAAYLSLHHGEIWGVTGGGEGMVTVLGIPVSSWSSGGRVVGREGRRIVTDMGGGLTVTTMGSPSEQSLLFQDSAPSAPLVLHDYNRDPFAPRSSTSRPHLPWDTSVLSGARLYAATPDSLRVADIRSGRTLFEVPWPAEVAAWMKTEAPEPAATAGVVSTAYQGQPGHATEVRSRLFFPGGEFLQDHTGSGVLCGPMATVSEDLWIVPLNERMILCLRGQPRNPPADSARTTAGTGASTPQR